MSSVWHEIFTFLQGVGLRDIIDIFVVAVFFYYILSAIKGSRAMQIVQGLIALILLLGIAYFAQMRTFSYLLNGILVSTLVALPVVFQPELRRALMRLGQQSILPVQGPKRLGQEDLAHVIDEITFAALSMSMARIGALIVIERETGLREIKETGQPVDGIVSAKLLHTIFFPKTPLHDGAAIISGNRVDSAACILPVTDSVVDARLGTRHRAAMGISEQTDAVVVVVSEETGEIRIVHEGAFSSPFSDEVKIKNLLNKLLVADITKSKVTRIQSNSEKSAGSK